MKLNLCQRIEGDVYYANPKYGWVPHEAERGNNPRDYKERNQSLGKRYKHTMN